MREFPSQTTRRPKGETTRRRFKRTTAFVVLTLAAATFAFSALGCRSTKDYRGPDTVGGFLGAEKP